MHKFNSVLRPLQSRSSSVLRLDVSLVHKRTKNALFVDFTRLDCLGKQSLEHKRREAAVFKEKCN